MTVTYGFYDSLNGDRKYNADQMGKIFDGIINDGVYSNVGGGLIVSAPGGMVINVASGRAWFSYTWTYNDATLALTVDAADATLNRIDTVVVEINKDWSVRANSIKIIKGTPAASPSAPTLSNTATLKQKPLANIYVGAGVSAINSGNLTNRVGTTDTPFVTGILTTIDFTYFYGRFETQFNAWLANLQNQLDANQAANLQNQIDVLTGKVDYGWIPATGWSYNSATGITVPTDATIRYQKGYGVRFKQGGGYKYMYITAVAATLLTVNGGSDYTVANAAITDMYYAPDPGSAFGFPSYFNYTVGGIAASNITKAARFSLDHGRCFVDFTCTFQGGITYTTAPTLPVTVSSLYKTLSTSISNGGFGSYLDAGTGWYINALFPLLMANATTFPIVTVNGVSMSATVPITWANGDAIEMHFSYEF